MLAVFRTVLGCTIAHLALIVVAEDWFNFESVSPDRSVIDLRSLNESFAGEHGYVQSKEGQFWLGNDKPVRFWAVNGPPKELKGEALKACARKLARYGVNLVRVHGAVFDKQGETDPAAIEHAQEVVAAMKAEGIYTHFSIYFPLWFTPSADLAWLPGYDGKQHPFAALMFNPEFQAKHRKWFHDLLTTPGKNGAPPLKEDPAVMGVEIQNEDSFFFWTFSEKNLPEPQLAMIEQQYAAWLQQQYGSIDKAFAAWKQNPAKQDRISDGRVALRPLWNIFNEKSRRDQDTARFLLEQQTKFYADTRDYIRSLGYRGLIHASNWSTASPEVFGPLEKLSYMTGDFIDRHGYFECNHRGDNAAWSIRSGHTYSHRSALRFDASEPGKPKQFVHPVMDPHYDDKPSMISETTFTRPNRYRTEAPLYFATYGALQDTDAIVHFAYDGNEWSVKPNFWMQQWTLGSPVMLGQFPAAALVYRQGLVRQGDVVATVHLNMEELKRLQGTPLPQDASLDELRLKDVPTAGTTFQIGQRVDPLLHYVGRTQVRFVKETPTDVKYHTLPQSIDRQQQRITSTTGELLLDYHQGLLTIDAPAAQGACGNLRSQKQIELSDIRVSSELDLGCFMLVSLDGKPIAKSQKMLLQVMSEERTNGFQSEQVESNVFRIKEIGRDPWQVRSIEGQVELKRADAGSLQVIALDHAGNPVKPHGTAASISLDPKVLYYLIQ